ncbi:hypothetical protein GCM10011428_17810 [Streptomyces violaceus]
MSTIVATLGTDRARRLRAALTALLVAAVALCAPFYFAPFQVFQLTMVLLYAVALAGLNLLVGFGGQISLGHGAFFAAGAYTAAVMLDRYDTGHLATLPVAAAGCFLLGLGFGVPALRLRGLYLALVTLAFAVFLPPLLKRLEPVTGGSMGLTVDKPQPPAWSGLAEDQWTYFVVLAVTAVACCCSPAPAAVPHRPGAARSAGQRERRGGHGRTAVAAQDARLRVERPVRGCLRVRLHLGDRLRLTRLVQLRPVHHSAGRPGGRRARLAVRTAAGGGLRDVRAERGPGHQRGGARCGVRPADHRGDVRGADGTGRSGGPCPGTAARRLTRTTTPAADNDRTSDPEPSADDDRTSEPEPSAPPTPADPAPADAEPVGAPPRTEKE